MAIITKPSIGTAPNDGTGTVSRTAWSLVRDAMTALEDHLNDVTSNPHAVTENQLSVTRTVPITVKSPTSGLVVPGFYTTQASTITEIRAVNVGGTTPSTTWTVRHDGSRAGTGTEVVTGGTVTTNTTTGHAVTTFNDATVEANKFVWLETTTVTGSPNYFEAHIIYTVD